MPIGTLGKVAPTAEGKNVCVMLQVNNNIGREEKIALNNQEVG